MRNGAPKSSLFPNYLFTEWPQTGLFLNWQVEMNFKLIIHLGFAFNPGIVTVV
jgi:hypothetical protein